MSTPTKDGGSAFPRTGFLSTLEDTKGLVAQYENKPQPGMTLRDWFAGQALATMTIAPDYSQGPCNYGMADRAYLIADAMLAARLKPSNT